jgi:hypothetical protein
MYPISKLYTDNTGQFLIKARSGNQYVMIAYHANGNHILQQAFKSRSNTPRIAAYNVIMMHFGGPRSLSQSPNLGQQGQCSLQARHRLYLASQVSVVPSGYTLPEPC